MVAYKINEDKRTVKCVLIDKCRGQIRKSVGYAYCSEEDEFDVEKGKKIAFLRARISEIGKNIGESHDLLRRIDAIVKSYKESINRKIVSQKEESDRLKAELNNLF